MKKKYWYLFILKFTLSWCKNSYNYAIIEITGPYVYMFSFSECNKSKYIEYIVSFNINFAYILNNIYIYINLYWKKQYI